MRFLQRISGWLGHTVLWNEATYLDGGPLQLGADVRLKASPDENGKLVATSIQIKMKVSKASKPESGQK